MADFTASIGYTAEEVVRLAKVMSEDLSRKAYDAGLDKGRKEGYEQGWSEGFAAGQEHPGTWSTINQGMVPLPPVEEVFHEEARGAHHLRPGTSTTGVLRD